MEIIVQFLTKQTPVKAGLVVNLRPWFVQVTLPITLGTLIYILFRSDQIRLVSFVRSFDAWEVLIKPYQSAIDVLASLAPTWLIDSLPDGLWTYALLMTGLLLWPEDKKCRSLWFAASIGVVLGTEMLQAVDIFPGVFCLYDLMFYGLAVITYFLVGKTITFSIQYVFYKKVLIPLLAGSFCFSLFACGSEVIVTTGQIAGCVGSLIKLMNEVKNASERTTATVGASYTILKTDVEKYPAFTYADPKIKRVILKMQSRLDTMRMRAAVLNDAMQYTSTTADALYDLLTNRANQNTSIDMREASLQKITNAKSQMAEKINEAKNAISLLNQTIQRYDNILNVIQIDAALNSTKVQISELDSIIAQTASLNDEVHKAIEEGQEVIMTDNPVEY